MCVAFRRLLNSAYAILGRMKRNPPQGGSVGCAVNKNNVRGFTIVETLIVIAVSGVLFLAAILMVAGQQRKVEFTQAVNDIKTVIDQTISEVATGYYPNTGNVRCAVSGGNLSITNAANAGQGANTGCIFLGKAMQFGVQDTVPQQFVVHSVAGLQNNSGSLASARPRAVDIDGTRETKELRNGLRATGMRYVVDGVRTNIGAVAFVNGLGQYGSSSQLLSGSQRMSMVPVTSSGVVPNTTVTAVTDAINTQLRTSDALLNPNGGVEICFEGGTSQWGLVTIGSNGRSLSVKLDIKNTDCQ
jgi:prepilin-type N-terminal cleavage/methylation domain-containing protein